MKMKMNIFKYLKNDWYTIWYKTFTDTYNESIHYINRGVELGQVGDTTKKDYVKEYVIQYSPIRNKVRNKMYGYDTKNSPGYNEMIDIFTVLKNIDCKYSDWLFKIKSQKSIDITVENYLLPFFNKFIKDNNFPCNDYLKNKSVSYFSVALTEEDLINHEKKR